VFRLGGNQGHGRVLGLVKLPELPDGLRADERGVAGEHQDVLVAGDGLSGALDGVAGAVLLFLIDEANAGGGHRRLDQLGLVADHGVDVGRGHDLAGSGNHVAQQGLAADLVQNLGPARLEAGSFAGGHDDDGQVRGWTRVCF
jgi:hypothetical protein